MSPRKARFRSRMRAAACVRTLLLAVLLYASTGTTKAQTLSNLWQTFEFDTLTVSNLDANDGVTAAGTWTIDDPGSLLSLSTSAEEATPGTVNGMPDSGTRGLVVDSSKSGDANVRFDFSAGKAVLSWGFWFKVSSAFVGSYDEHDIFVARRFLGNTNVYIKLTDNRQARLQLFKEGAGYTSGVSISPDTWYWVTGKWVLNTASYFRVYDPSGSQVGAEQSIPSSVTDVISYFSLGSFIGRTKTTTKGTLYFDDLLVDWTNGVYPLGVPLASSVLLRGTITDRATNAPIAGASVTLSNGNAVTVTTDSSGAYSITGQQWPFTGSATVYIQANGYYGNQASVNIVPPYPVTLSNTIRLGGAVLRGTVTDASTSLPIVNAVVNYAGSNTFQFGASTKTTTTDVSGSYILDSSQFSEAAATSGTSGTLGVTSPPGYFASNPSVAAVPPFPAVTNVSLTSTGVTSLVTLTTVPAGLQIVVDNVVYTGPQTFAWVPNTVHTIAASASQSASPGVRYPFSGWSDGGAISHMVVAPSSNTALTASFTTQYLLTTLASPANGGSVTPGGWVNAGTSVLITATANTGYKFTGFSGDLAGTVNPQTILVSGPSTVTAIFGLIQPTTTTLTSSLNPSVAGQTVNVTATVNAATPPTGTVTFMDGPVNIATVPLSGNQAVYSTSALAAGVHVLTAIYSGGGVYTGSTSGALNQSVVAFQPGGAVFGAVTDRATTQPIGNASVKLCVPIDTLLNGGTCSLLTTTDANGLYALTGAQLGATNGGLLFQVQGYYANPLPFTTNPATPTQVNATLLPGGDVLRGIVTDSVTQEGIVGATVSFFPDSPLISADGGSAIQALTITQGAYVLDSSHFMEGAAGGFQMDSAGSIAYVSAPGYLTYAMPGFTAIPPYPVVQNFALDPDGPSYDIPVATTSTGVLFIVDGLNYSAPHVFRWPSGSIHHVAVTSPQGDTNSRYVFNQWSDGGAASHQVTIPPGGATYTAVFAAQYQLTTSVTPASAGTITAGGWFDSGAAIPILATPNSSYQFSGFSGALSGTTNPQTLVLNSPAAVTASFVTTNLPPAISSPASTTFTVGLPGSFAVTASGSPAPALSESGALPAGVTFNASTGVMSGTPTGSPGTYSVTFTAANGVGSNAVQNFTLTLSLPSVVSVALNPTSVTGGAGNSTGTVTLNAPATGTTAQRTVTLLSSNTVAATVPTSVTVSTGATSATFTVTSHVVTAVANPVISATLGGSATATLTVNPFLVTSVTLNPASVSGGIVNSTGTVTLNSPAAGTTAQRTVALSSSNTAAATVPASVTVSSGSTSATFTVTSHAVATSTPANISVTLNGATQSAVLNVVPAPAVTSLTLTQTSLVGGSANSTATVTLNAPAVGTASQRTVTLSSSNTAAATVPASVRVSAGSTSAAFTVTSHVVTAVANPVITATLRGSATATLTVNPLQVVSVALSPTSVSGGIVNSTATITLNAPAAGTNAQRTVTLASSNTAAATVPSSLLVSSGATSATFTVTSYAVGASTTANISATLNGGTQSAALTVN